MMRSSHPPLSPRHACSDSAALEHSAEARDAELCAALLCARARCAWALKQHTLARGLLARASDAAARVAAGAPGAAAAAASERLANVYFECGRALLGADDTAASAAPLLQAAHEHASAAHAAAGGVGTGSTARLCFKTLQCLAVAHLKAGAHELALNCARTLATQAAAVATPTPAAAGDAPGPSATAPSGLAAAAATAARAAQFLCINALCGLRRLEEAVDALTTVADDAAACASSADLLCDSAACVLRAGRPDAAAAAVGALLAAAPSAAAAPALRFLEAALSDVDARPAALALLSSEAAATALKGDGSGGAARKRLAHLQALLWNGATTLFEAKDCAPARCSPRAPLLPLTYAPPCVLARCRRARALRRRLLLRGGGRPQPRARRARRMPVPAGAARAR
jgi:hypothetical protein